jgi:hypothetical protein
LLADGRVDRPALAGPMDRRRWAYGSRWESVGDTLLHIRLASGTAGWNLRLVPVPERSDTIYVGVARYLSDVIVRDTAASSQPPPVPVRVRREPCAPPT